MTQPYRFRAYDLVFESAIDIPEMTPADAGDARCGAPDVSIRVAEFPDELADAVEESSAHQVNADALLLRIDGISRYLVRDGREILIDPEAGVDPHEVRVYLLGTCLGALLHQRGFLVLHASGVCIDGSAVLFTGVSGAGKSTLLGELLRRGYPMMVDDVCAVRVDGARPVVVPSYPRTRLWADAAERFSIDTTGLPRTRPSWDKFERQVGEQFADREAVLTHVFHLAEPNDEDEFSHERLGAIESFTTLAANTYRGILLDGLGIRASHFTMASQVAKAVQVHRIRRPARTYRLEELADLVIASVGQTRD